MGGVAPSLVPVQDRCIIAGLTHHMAHEIPLGSKDGH